MPYVEEKDLLSLHSQIQKEQQTNNRLLDQIRVKNKEITRVSSSKRMTSVLSVIFALAFFGLAAVLYIFPELISGDSGISVIDEMEKLEVTKSLSDSVVMLKTKVIKLEDALSNVNEQNKVEENQNKIEENQTETNKVEKKQIETNKESIYKSQKKEFDKRMSREEDIYSVQIGAFKNKKMMMYSDNFVNFRGYPRKEYFAYSIGNFKTAVQAAKFKNELRRLGFKDAFVTKNKVR